jgi:hypothetical protein
LQNDSGWFHTGFRFEFGAIEKKNVIFVPTKLHGKYIKTVEILAKPKEALSLLGRIDKRNIGIGQSNRKPGKGCRHWMRVIGQIGWKQKLLVKM